MNLYDNEDSNFFFYVQQNFVIHKICISAEIMKAVNNSAELG